MSLNDETQKRSRKPPDVREDPPVAVVYDARVARLVRSTLLARERKKQRSSERLQREPRPPYGFD